MSFHTSESTAVASSALSHISVASWSALDNVYQQNVADATATILEVLQSPHNTWNYPSPLDIATRVFQPITSTSQSPQLQYSPSPTPVWATLDNIKDFPFLNVPNSPQYIVTSAPVSPAPVNSLDTLAHVAFYKPEYCEDKKENLLPAPTQDSFVHQHLGHDLREYVVFEDIPAAPLLSPIVAAPIATVPSPTPKPCSPSTGLLLLLLEQPIEDLFPHLFNAPACTLAVNCHPYQYSVVYNRGEKHWVLQEEYIERDFLRLLLRIPNLETYPVSFITPFRADIYHNVHIHTISPLPSIHICAKVGQHPHSTSFPFGYLESSFVDSLKFVFSQFPLTWLKYFEGSLVPLVAYDFLDG